MNAPNDQTTAATESEWEHLPNAPIAEAAVEFRVSLPADITIQKLSPMQNEIRDDYPVRRKNVMIQGELSLKMGAEPEVSTRSKHGATGYQFASQDGLRVCQVGLKSFGFSWLKPYPTWNKFSSEAVRLWDIYKRHAKPQNVRRAGLRYINRMETGEQSVQLVDWLRIGPQIPQELPQSMAGFFIRMVIGFEPEMAAAIITLTAEERTAPDGIPIILDIDAVTEKGLKTDTDVLAGRLSALREVKNRVFFKSVTDKFLARCR